MATLTGEYTLLDLKAMHDPMGNVAKAIDVISQVNSVMEDAIWVEANDLTSHVVTQTLSEGSGQSGVINEAVDYEEDIVKQVREPLEIFESYSRIDERLIRRARNPEQFRAQKNAMRLRGMAKSWHNRFFYGNDSGAADETLSEANVTGLSARFDALADTNVVGASGTGSDLTSIWVIQWGEEGVHLLFPRGEKTVIEEEDLGRQLVSGTTRSGGTGAYTALVSHYMLNWGLAVADPRCAQRIANIETSGTSNIFDEDDLIAAINRLPDPSNIERTRIYVNRDIKTQMDIALKDKSNVYYNKTDAFGGKGGILTFNGIPVRMVDKLLSTEDALS